MKMNLIGKDNTKRNPHVHLKSDISSSISGVARLVRTVPEVTPVGKDGARRHSVMPIHLRQVSRARLVRTAPDIALPMST